MRFVIAITAVAVLTGAALAQQPYAGLQNRQIKTLSDQQIADLNAGRGMGLALAAELNGYPGPIHAIELASELHLLPEPQQLTLWNQMGSRVIRGNLLVIPIENSILYVSPLYLRAAEGQLPELKRVIAAYGDRVVMKETLAEALSALFESGAAPSASMRTPLAAPSAEQAREALDHFNQAIERLKSGDWAGFGAQLDAMRGLLENLSRQPIGH